MRGQMCCGARVAPLCSHKLDQIVVQIRHSTIPNAADSLGERGHDNQFAGCRDARHSPARKGGCGTVGSAPPGALNRGAASSEDRRMPGCHQRRPVPILSQTDMLLLYQRVTMSRWQESKGKSPVGKHVASGGGKSRRVGNACGKTAAAPRIRGRCLAGAPRHTSVKPG